MSKVSRIGWMALWGVAVFLAAGVVPFAQGPTGNPYGNVFAGEPRPRVLRKYVKVR